MTLGLRVRGARRAVRDLVSRANRVLAEADYADDMVFHVRTSSSARRLADRERPAPDARRRPS